MASSFGSFVSASDFSFATNLTTTNGGQTFTTINWNFASSVVEVRNLASGQGTTAGVLSLSDTLGVSPLMRQLYWDQQTLLLLLWQILVRVFFPEILTMRITLATEPALRYLIRLQMF